MTRKRNKIKIAFYLHEGVEILDVAGPLEVFAIAGYEIMIVAKTKKPITSQGILKILPDYSIEDSINANVLAVFGGNPQNAYKDKYVIDWIKSQQGIESYFSVCSGAFVLAEAGILDGKTATTYHRRLDQLEKRYPKITVKRDVRFVDNGSIITTAGVSAGIDGALHFVAKHQGIEKAFEIANYMEYDKWNHKEGLVLISDE